MNHIEVAKESIENFSIDENHYYTLSAAGNVIARGNGSVFCKEENTHAEIKIEFGQTKGCKVYLGRNMRGKISVMFKGDNSLLFIGDNCKLVNLKIRSFQSDDFIAVGSSVTTTSDNIWISGNGAGEAKPAIIIGDDCMFSYDIVIRNSDAHPIYSLTTGEQVNEPKAIVHIEPHVWIGEQVTILKAVKIGACSILSLGSIITKDVPRFSVANGVPAKAKVNDDIFWSRNTTSRAKERARHFVNKYRLSSEM